MISDDGTLAPNAKDYDATEHSLQENWQFLKLHIEAMAISNENLLANERSIKKRVELLLTMLDLEEELAEDPHIGLDAIYTKVEEMKNELERLTEWDLDNDNR